MVDIGKKTKAFALTFGVFILFFFSILAFLDRINRIEYLIKLPDHRTAIYDLSQLRNDELKVEGIQGSLKTIRVSWALPSKLPKKDVWAYNIDSWILPDQSGGSLFLKFKKDNINLFFVFVAALVFLTCIIVSGRITFVCAIRFRELFQANPSSEDCL